ncbi:MAG: mechanosensitive ion channel [Planctomycetes bacterium]|nr:mechanosensitive ion channel [Planctomycetota bacterium]
MSAPWAQGSIRARLIWWGGWAVAWLAFSRAAAPAIAQPQPQLAQAQPQAVPPAAATAEPPAVPAVTTDILQARRKEVEEAKDLDESVRTKALELYKQAAEQLRAAEDFQTRAGVLEKERAVAPERLQALEESLSAPPPELVPPLSGELSTSELDSQLAEARHERAEARKELERLKAEPQRREERRPLVFQELKKARERLEGIQKALAARPAEGEPPELAQANRLLLESQKRAVEAEISWLQQEVPTYDATDALLNLQRKAAEARVQRAEKLADRLREFLAQRRKAEADAQLQSATDHLEELRRQHLPEQALELLASYARQNIEWAGKRNGPQGLTERIHRVDGTAQAATDALKRVGDDLKNVEEKLDIPGIEDVKAQLLISTRRDLLPMQRAMQRSLRGHQSELARVRLERMQVREEIEALADPAAQAETLLLESGIAFPSEAARRRMVQELEQVLAARLQILESVRGDYRDYFRKLVEVSTKEQQLLEDIREFLDLIDRHILWVRNAQPVGRAELMSASRALRWLTSPTQWLEVSGVLVDSIAAAPLAAALAGLVLVLLYWSRRRQMRLFRKLTEEATGSYTQPFRYTLQLLGLILLLSAFWPALVWFVGWRLWLIDSGSEFARAVGAGFMVMAFAWFTLDALRRLCRPRGFAENHFRWRRDRLRVIRRHLRWLIPLGMPTVFVVTVTNQQANEAFQTSLGRFALMAGLVFIAGFLGRILRDLQKPAAESSGHAAATVEWSRWQWARYLISVGGPLVLVGLAAAGYYYTAQQLTWRLLATGWLVLALVIIHSTAVRWLYAARARLALERVRAAQEAGDAAGEVSATAVEIVQGEIHKAGADLASVNAQTRRLLKVAVAFSFVAGGWLIWADVLPALGFLEYEVWSSTAEVTRMVPGPNDSMQPVEVTETVSYTLIDVLLAVAVVTIAFIAAANVPGLLEVAVLQHLPLDAGGRYAAASLAKYTFYVVGVLAGLSLVGIGWGKLQWLVAAVGIGLGFGLQEIFANFVSGIILLFERPIRVGDIVTVENTSGVVTRIQIRATTVRNWDRREYIIPNKELITGRLLNWTLTDTINRIVVNVGVAYGSDCNRTRNVLLEIARANPNVAADPPPLANFDGFGDSTLNFVLRAYVSSMERWLDTVHELHTAIHDRFAQEGIEIAFPQRDLRIRAADRAAVINLAIDGNGTHGNGNGKSHSLTHAAAGEAAHQG